MSVEYTKNLVGKPIVKFDCPKCQLRLSAMLSEAGTHDKCPECGQGFKVPGEQKLKQVEEKRRLAQEAKSAARKRRSEDAKAQKLGDSGFDHSQSSDSGDALVAQSTRKPREFDERWLVDPEEMQPVPATQGISSSTSDAVESTSAGSSDVAVQSHQAGDGAEEFDREDREVEEVRDHGGPELGHGDGRQYHVVPNSSRGWWRDSVRFESVSASRYPALMAFRNLMVLLWWIMLVCSVFAFVANPFVLMYNGYAVYASASRSCDQRLEPYNNPTVDALMAPSAQGKGLSAKDASRLLDELSNYEYRGFQIEYRINRNASVSPQTLASVVADWRAWIAGKKAEIDQDRPSLIMAIISVVFLILVYWVALILGMVICSVVILVPPECIKLVIDIEHGVRVGNTTTSA